MRRTPRGAYPPGRGVLLRTFVEGPFGSVVRTDWVEYSSVLLVAGGSGVSFALSAFVYHWWLLELPGLLSTSSTSILGTSSNVWLMSLDHRLYTLVSCLHQLIF